MPRKPKPAPTTEPEVLTSHQDDDGKITVRVIDEAEANRRIDAAPANTLGDHVADAAGRAQKIPWKHDVGSSVLLLTDGQPPRKAVIRNITDQGAFAHYDLNLGADGGTVDGVEAWRIGRDLDAEGELAQLRDHLALLQRHNDRAKELAQKHVEMEAEDRRLADLHADHRKRMREVAAQLAQHVRSDPGQTDLLDVVGEMPAAGDAPHPADDTSAAAVARRIAAGDVIELADLAVSFDDLRAARLERATASTGKPQQVKPASIGVESHVLVDVQNGVAVLAPILERKAWVALYQETYGPPLGLPSEDGDLTGNPVRVGRQTLFICPPAVWLLVRLPPDLANAGDAEPAPSGKDAAAGA